eukprot:TRINITY_DN443_c0_g1_i1.p1 TRINITY_DN443_c0_g1~~TRINITY_DN443_c0_g1_i1.p1  ORF type:complete len:264 (+),score=56.99 TRINITY_DN443_c0_g1_i1:187-978(+)
MKTKESLREEKEHGTDDTAPSKTKTAHGKRKRSKVSNGSLPDTKKGKRDHHHPPPKTESVAFDFRKAQPDASDVVLHGAASLKLAVGKQVRNMSQSDQNMYIQSVTEDCEKLIRILNETVQAFSKNEDALDVEEQLMSDMSRLKNIPIARRYVEMTLWRRVKLFSRERLQIAEELGYGIGKRKKGEGFLLHRGGAVDPNFVSYRDSYMKTVIERYQDDLEKIRERESLDAERVQFLLQCLQSGADLFANLRCVEDMEMKKQEK